MSEGRCVVSYDGFAVSLLCRYCPLIDDHNWMKMNSLFEVVTVVKTSKIMLRNYFTGHFLNFMHT